MSHIDLKKMHNVAMNAWLKALQLHDDFLFKNPDTRIKLKNDSSPVTELDLQIHESLSHSLQMGSQLPVYSEESDSRPGSETMAYWLIDPIDGTKEFTKGLVEYTVNIALIANGKPVIGLIGQPKTKVHYHATAGHGAYKNQNRIYSNANAKSICVSRSHLNEITEKFAANFSNTQLIRMGSSLKFCLIAEGLAFVYPRLGPINEWDFAAADILLTESGAILLDLITLKEISYSHSLHAGVIACSREHLTIVIETIQKLGFNFS